MIKRCDVHFLLPAVAWDDLVAKAKQELSEEEFKFSFFYGWDEKETFDFGDGVWVSLCWRYIDWCSERQDVALIEAYMEDDKPFEFVRHIAQNTFCAFLEDTFR